MGSGNNPTDVFTEIYKKNIWNSSESPSGPGSELVNTRNLMEELPLVLRDFNISSLLDLPCGDFNWMQHVNLSGVRYIGGDVVSEIVERNNALYSNEQRTFKLINLLSQDIALPKVDAVFCRDCLVHLPLTDIFIALQNICQSGALYLITTHYSFLRYSANSDIEMGQWRRLNLEIAPFFFPPPLKYIIEGSIESGGKLCDKVSAVWSISQIKKIVNSLCKR